MRQARKFLALSWRERWLLARAVVMVGSMRLASAARPARRPQDVDRVAWAVSAAARSIPRATCLTQALAARQLLARCGEPSDLHIGVAQDAERGIAAHAWLAAGGRVVIGGETLERYLPLTARARRRG